MSVASLLYQTFIICALSAICSARIQACNGTSNGQFSTGRGFREHYEFLRAMYTNCTHVATNLEITYMSMNDDVPVYDFGFLQDIRYVTGYVLIDGIGSNVGTFGLYSLEVIRGNATFYDRSTRKRATLAVINNPGITRLHLLKLREITKGNVLFSHNRNMKYVDRINWRAIQKVQIATVTHNNGYVYPPPQSGSLSNSYFQVLDCPGNHGWDDNPLQCQAGLEVTCHVVCNGRCWGEGRSQCCHSACAIGCSGRYPTQCTVCKDLKVGDRRCVRVCPRNTYKQFPICVRYFTN